MAATGKPLVLTLKSDGNYTMAEALAIDVSTIKTDVITAFNSTTGIDIQTTATFLSLTSTHLAANKILLGEADVLDWSSDQGSSNLHTGNYTNTTYAIADGGLSQNNFTNADHSKLNAIEAAADVTDITNVNASFTDNSALKLGSGDDSHLSYDGTNTNWNLHQVGTGKLNVTGSIDVTGWVAVTGGVYVTGLLSPTGGATFTGGDLKLNDNVKLVLGTGSDSFMKFDGTGTLLNLGATQSLFVTGGTAYTKIGAVGTATSALFGTSGPHTLVENTADGNIIFITNGDRVMTMEPGGTTPKVGINTLDPGQLLDVVDDTAGAGVSVRVEHKDNSNAGSDARYIAKVAGTSSGDPHMRFMIQGGQSWCMGLANGASDNFRIADANNLDSNVALEIDTTQNVWMKESLAVGQGSVADGAAVLELVSTTKAFLPPRMTTTQRNLISGAAGMTIYNTTTNKLQCHNGSGWQDCF